MHCPNCNALLEEGSAFCGNCGKQVAPLLARGATVGELTEISHSNDFSNHATAAETLYSPPPPRASIPTPPQAYGTYQQVAPPVGNMPSTPPAMPPVQSGRGLSTRTVAFIAIILLLLVLSVSAGVLALTRGGSNTASQGGKNATAATNPTTGAGAAADVAGLGAFSDSGNSTTPNSTVKITANGLKAPPAGHQYEAWLVDSQNESVIISLGTLTLQPDK